MLGRNKSASELGFTVALSPTAVSAAGSTNASPLGNQFNFLTLGVWSSSADAVVNLEKSGASDAGFAQAGLSIQAQASKLVMRSIQLTGSGQYYRLSYDNNNAGSATLFMFLVGDGARRTPIEQDGDTAVLSTIL